MIKRSFNRIFRTDINPGSINFILLATRLVIAGFMLTHGYPKLEKLLAGGDISFSDPFGIGPELSLGLVVFAEFFCSLLIALGLGTRLASIPLAITMFVAAFISHGDDPFSRKEKALLFLLIYLVLLVTGSGKYSIDHLISGKRAET